MEVGIKNLPREARPSVLCRGVLPYARGKGNPPVVAHCVGANLCVRPEHGGKKWKSLSSE